MRGAAAEVAAAAARAGAAVHLVPPVAGKAELLDAFAQALDFPAWVGRNWDALADALRDLSWLPAGPHAVVWAGSDALRAAHPATYATALDVLRDAAAASTDRPLTVLLVSTPGRTAPA